MFLIGPSQDCLFADFFADYNVNDNLNPDSLRMMKDLCAKLGVDENLEPTLKAKEIIEKMEKLETLKNSLN